MLQGLRASSHLSKPKSLAVTHPSLGTEQTGKAKTTAESCHVPQACLARVGTSSLGCQMPTSLALDSKRGKG